MFCTENISTKTSCLEVQAVDEISTDYQECQSNFGNRLFNLVLCLYFNPW